MKNLIRGFQWDLARQVERLEHLAGLLPRYAEWGYQRLYLHLEDAVDYPSLPGVARADAYRWKELERLVEVAGKSGVSVVPIANLLGHTQYLIKTEEWRDLNELRDAATGAPLATGQVCPLHPRMGELTEKLFGDLAPLCTAGEIHAGLDESFHLGKHPASRAEVAQVGLAGHFARHVARLHAAAARRGLRLGMWADMLALLPEAAGMLPAGAGGDGAEGGHGGGRRGIAAYDWYYHPFGRKPRMELYGFSEYDLAPALRAAGAGYWACPMNGAFRHEVAPVWGDRLQNIAAWWRRAQAVEAEGFLMTSWEAYRLALPTTTLMDAAAATLWLEPERGDDPATLLAAGLRRWAGREAMGAVTARGLARGLLATDAMAFVGNSRWEINTRWDSVGARREGAAPFAREARRLRRLAETAGRAKSQPTNKRSRQSVTNLVTLCRDHEARRAAEKQLAVLEATVRFQAYLAERDAFVRRAGRLVERLRRLAAKNTGPESVTNLVTLCREEAVEFAERMRGARKDARAMWVASRPGEAFAGSHNAGVLRGDAARLRAWLGWLRAAARRTAHARRAAVVAGRWSLRFTVHVETPAWQKVLVEQLGTDGLWREIYGRVLIEFRGETARPRTPRLRLEFACPVENPKARLRIVSRCVGQVAISHAELTDGVTTRRAQGGRMRRLLGEPVVPGGWPKVDWVANTGAWEPVWG